MKHILILFIFAALAFAQPQPPAPCGANGQNPCSVVTDGSGNVTLPGTLTVGKTVSAGISRHLR